MVRGKINTCFLDHSFINITSKEIPAIPPAQIWSQCKNTKSIQNILKNWNNNTAIIQQQLHTIKYNSHSYIKNHHMGINITAIPNQTPSLKFKNSPKDCTFTINQANPRTWISCKTNKEPNFKNFQHKNKTIHKLGLTPFEAFEPIRCWAAEYHTLKYQKCD